MLNNVRFYSIVKKSFGLAAISLMLAGCGNSLKSSNQDMWNNYDYRHPAPAVAVPGGTDYTDQYGQYYQDNDSYYTAPSEYGCSPADIGLLGCE